MDKFLNRMLNTMMIITAIALIGLGVFIWHELSADDKLANTADDPMEEKAETTAAKPTEEETTVNKDAELYVESDSESAYQQKIHEMTHQKVYAAKKWGSLEITDKRIDEMLAKLDESDFEHEDYYRKVLKAWKKGNFDNAVQVHNKIWEIQGGTIGEASRLLTPEEERAYKENHFE